MISLAKVDCNCPLWEHCSYKIALANHCSLVTGVFLASFSGLPAIIHHLFFAFHVIIETLIGEKGGERLCSIFSYCYSLKKIEHLVASELSGGKLSKGWMREKMANSFIKQMLLKFWRQQKIKWGEGTGLPMSWSMTLHDDDDDDDTIIVKFNYYSGWSSYYSGHSPAWDTPWGGGLCHPAALWLWLVEGSKGSGIYLCGEEYFKVWIISKYDADDAFANLLKTDITISCKIYKKVELCRALNSDNSLHLLSKKII